MSRKPDDLAYIAPPAPTTMVRRVYQLPRRMVERIHEYGYDNGHPSEVSAVRELISSALAAREAKP